MQFMYLRKQGTAKNKGRHPIGIIAIDLDGPNLSVAVSTIHSSDKFEKKIARDLIKKKLQAGNVTVINLSTEVTPRLYSLLPKNFARRLGDYARHEKGFLRLIEDDEEENQDMTRVPSWEGISNNI